MSWDDLTDEERGYIAGIVDADGSITISKQNTGGAGYYRPALCIYNSREGLLKWIAQKIGVHVGYHLDKRIDARHRVESYHLTIRRLDDVKTILVWLEPHLRIKSEQARLAIETVDLIQNRDSWKYTDQLLDQLESNHSAMAELNTFDTEVEA